MSTGTAIDSDVSGNKQARTRRIIIHWIFWLANFCFLTPIIFVMANTIGQIVVIAGLLASGEIAFGDPRYDYEAVHGALDGLVIALGVLIVLIGLWVISAVLWYRKALRLSPAQRRGRAGPLSGLPLQAGGTGSLQAPRDGGHGPTPLV
jgi:hypothetical protein